MLDKNPLENIRNSDSVRFVMLNGRLYDAATLDQIAPRRAQAAAVLVAAAVSPLGPGSGRLGTRPEPVHP